LADREAAGTDLREQALGNSELALAAVQRAIRKTGYVINQHARSLVNQRSQSVAFVLSEPQERLFEDFTEGDVYYHPFGKTVTEADNHAFTLMTQGADVLDAVIAGHTVCKQLCDLQLALVEDSAERDGGRLAFEVVLLVPAPDVRRVVSRQ
jgi:hypothetical protein